MKKNFGVGALQPAFKNKLITCAMVVAFFALSVIAVKLGMAGSLFEGLLVPMCYYIIMYKGDV